MSTHLEKERLSPLNYTFRKGVYHICHIYNIYIMGFNNDLKSIYFYLLTKFYVIQI